MWPACAGYHSISICCIYPLSLLLPPPIPHSTSCIKHMYQRMCQPSSGYVQDMHISVSTTCACGVPSVHAWYLPTHLSRRNATVLYHRGNIVHFMYASSSIYIHIHIRIHCTDIQHRHQQETLPVIPSRALHCIPASIKNVVHKRRQWCGWGEWLRLGYRHGIPVESTSGTDSIQEQRPVSRHQVRYAFGLYKIIHTCIQTHIQTTVNDVNDTPYVPHAHSCIHAYTFPHAYNVSTDVSACLDK